ncbi:MAG TPA: portal protein [Patescibacteria group bacterium]|nr:portal protein [Patescibacteria group bacterium]
MTSTSLDSSDESNNTNSLLDGLVKSREERERNARLLAWANQEFSKCKRARQVVERQWYINLAFYFGKQNIQLITGNASTTGFQLTVPKAPAWRVRLVINKIRPIIRNELSKLTSGKPNFTVVPATTEDEDIVAARVAENIVTAAYRDKSVHKILRSTVWWGSICGTSFTKTYWDPSIQTPDGQVGDIVIERVDPFHLFVPDLREEEIEKQPYVIHATTKSPDWLKQVYGIEVNATTKAAHDLLEDSFLNLVGVQNDRREVLCLEFWIKKGTHPEFPEGGLLTIAGDKVVVNTGEIKLTPDGPVGGYPYKHGEYPFAKFEHIPSGKFYGDSVVTDLVPLQREYNRTRSQIVEAKNLMAKPKLMAPRGSVNPRQITSEPGQVILYTPGMDKPTPLPMDGLPQYVLQEIDRLQQDMDDISGQHEISRGQNPSQVTAATALSFLQEQDESKLAYSIASIEEMVEKIGRHYLHFVTQFWDVPRMVRVTGTDGAFEAAQWKGSDLKGNVDIRVESGSALPKSKAAKQAFLMDVFKMGAIEAPMFLELLDLGGIEKAYEDFLIDKRQAQRENFKITAIAESPEFIMAQQEAAYSGQPFDPMESGLGITANTWDNHQLHIMIHNAYRKTQKFEMLPEEVKILFEAHVTQHQIALMQGTMTQLPNGEPGPVVGGPPTMEQGQPGSQPPGQEQQGPPPGPQGGFPNG